jgi:hypothetical protein
MSNDKPRPLFPTMVMPLPAEPVPAKPARGPRPLFGQKSTVHVQRPPNAIFDAKAQAIVDSHLSAIMSELDAVGVKPVGIVAGVLHDGETSVNWCVSDDVHDDDGKVMTSEEVAREIAVDVERSTAGE